ncbi:sulfatase-like hydrolase/transferase [Paraglaciecola chathamensis]|uniref:sulfatase-like hydrolase/transferase n=1 Tax=Paraglaciecola chathamensis TaxID=368405 RepID=UPI0026FBB431|nr:sulfatase-like hydrolase/transferase [Paraglaciecola chathamensis]MDO6840191.1 sulfatase-like hydrolase/transferase [Paraglaciecola chathamensis]
MKKRTVYGSVIIRSLILLTGLLPLSFSWGQSNGETAVVKRPNFVWIVSEDNSAEFLKLYNPDNPDGFGVSMPNVEKLAAKGLIFNSAFSNAPVCSTARTTLATGAYGPRIGTEFHRPYKLATLPDDVKSIGQLMQEAGYYTSNNAKNDFNFTEKTKTTVWNDTSKTASWNGRKADQPFFHMQTWKDTHEHTLHFPIEDLTTHMNDHSIKNMDRFPIYPDTALFRYTLERYLDNHVIIDNKLGQMVKKLADEGLLEDTFIFYFGDHGGVMPASKGYLFERGLHVPLVVRIPEHFRYLLAGDMQNAQNARLDGFVNFIDFAPTILKLAGIKPSPQHDGRAFLGNDVSKKSLATRDYSFSYADRFDEKYDLLRAIRKGNFKYIRSYQPYYPDGMFAEYRYKQAAYREWKALYEKDKLPPTQSAFFRAKSPERLYDIASDPDELHDLADDPQYHDELVKLRAMLNKQLKSMPDLSFYPEAYLLENMTNNPVVFGQQHKDEISELIDIANLQLQSFDVVEKQLAALLKSTSPWQRYWALIVLSSFGHDADVFIQPASKLLENDDNFLVRGRAAEFLGIVGKIDPVVTLGKMFAEAPSDIALLELLNIATYFHESGGWIYPETLMPERRKTLSVRALGYRMMDTWLTARWKYISTEN